MHRREQASVVIARPIYSPFDPHEVVGKISLLVDHAAIHAEAASYSRASTLAMVPRGRVGRGRWWP